MEDDIILVQMGFKQDTLDLIEELSLMFGTENKTNTVALSIKAVHMLTTYIKEGSDIIVRDVAKDTELKLEFLQDIK